MPDRNEDAFEAVVQALRRADDRSRDELLEIATEIDPEIEDLSGPEFQGRYYLPALNRLRSESAEEVPCPFCGSGPYQGPKSLALHRKFCSSWDEEDGEPLSGETAYRLALDGDADSGRAESGAPAERQPNVPPMDRSSERGDRTGTGSAPGSGSTDDAGDPGSCPYCSAAISDDGHEVRAGAIADHLRSCADRPRWDLAETSSRPPPEELCRILHDCSRKIAHRADDRDVLGATEALLEAADEVYRAFGHEPPMTQVAPGDLRFQRSAAPSWLTKIRSALPFGDDARAGKRG